MVPHRAKSTPKTALPGLLGEGAEGRQPGAEARHDLGPIHKHFRGVQEHQKPSKWRSEVPMKLNELNAQHFHAKWYRMIFTIPVDAVCTPSTVKKAVADPLLPFCRSRAGLRRPVMTIGVVRSAGKLKDPEVSPHQMSSGLSPSCLAPGPSCALQWRRKKAPSRACTPSVSKFNRVDCSKVHHEPPKTP